MSDIGLQDLPRLETRHAAMLAEMGINCWWQEAQARQPPATQPAAAPAVRGVTAAATSPAATRVPQPSRQQERPAPPTVTAPAPVPARAVIPLAEVPTDQAALAEAIRACRACDLGTRRRQAVPGMGDPAPDWLIVGEAPGEEEDRQGLPFVGRAGQLLDRMLAAMGLDRQHQVYIANVIKCRPPQNRNPDPVEIAQCEPYLLRQIELLRPRFILALGRFAAYTLLAHATQPGADSLRQLPLGKLRGRVHEIEIAGRRLPLVVSYHPAYLLRSPAEKAKSWADLCLALDAFGRLPPRG
ncbi:uracil-DNA glycosylase [Malikia sp.]|uniref:uracil-DNA glycosylase n=1 Tax=Malikia sp. TaxID=2070706 RepID=UPI002636B27E|nr:uracil-DNA glycosylase [Malikia sp.]MDD2728914.1 uracil-DNA glycosylase [Malikia sp.]